MAASCVALLGSTTAFAHSGGITGSATAGCSVNPGCHSAMSASTTVQIMGPTSVVRGSMNTYELIITNMAATQTGAGLDVAANAGTLGTSAMAPLTQVLGGEVTHRSAIARPSAGGAWRIPFTWTAPATAGSARLNAAGNAVNGLAGSVGDQWNVGSLAITITDTAMGDSGVSTPDASTPLPDGSAPPPADSGVVPPADAALPPQDSGELADTGAPPSDVSAPTDSGVASDSGVAADGGTGMQMGGCACTATPAAVNPRLAMLSVAALAAFATKRRRRTAR